jgi:hypothetical protein
MGGSRRVPLPAASARSAAKTAAARTKRPKATSAPKPASRADATQTRAARSGGSSRAKARPTATRAGAKARKTAASGRVTKAAKTSKATASGTYVYCVVRAGVQPQIASQVEALPGAGAPRVLGLAADTWLIVANVPLKAFGEAALHKRMRDVDWMSRCGVAHQAVIDSFLGADAVVPMTLFTIFANALAEARKDAARLEASLDRVAGRVEWVVRVLRGDAAASPAADAAASDGSTVKAAAPRSGREFLQAKVDQRQAARRAVEETGLAVSALMTALSDVADDVSERTDEVTTGGLRSAALLDAAFLVARTAEVRFEEAARRMGQPLLDRGFRVSVTGPWACYSFVSSSASKASSGASTKASSRASSRASS